MVTRASWSSTIRTSGFTPLAPPFLSGRSTDGLTGIDHLEARQVPLWTATAAALSGRQVMGGLGDVGGMVADALEVLGDEQQMCAWRATSEAHTSELMSLIRTSYDGLRLK